MRTIGTQQSVYRRAAALTMLLSLAFAALGARCIEATHVHVDRDGYTHITGEMVNETGIQGTNITLRATLFDDGGNVVATKDGPTCPPDTQPHSTIMFDIRFDNPDVPPWSTYDVRPISGKALAAPLPDPDIAVIEMEAIRFEGIPPIPGLFLSNDDVLMAFNVRNRSGHVLEGVQGCAAVYDNHGAIIAANTGELISVDENGLPHPAQFHTEAPETAFFLFKDVPIGSSQVRGWLWFGPKAAATSQYQFFSTPLITIQTRTLP
jgi:hypothetical protein